MFKKLFPLEKLFAAYTLQGAQERNPELKGKVRKPEELEAQGYGLTEVVIHDDGTPILTFMMKAMEDGIVAFFPDSRPFRKTKSKPAKIKVKKTERLYVDRKSKQLCYYGDVELEEAKHFIQLGLDAANYKGVSAQPKAAAEVSATA